MACPTDLKLNTGATIPSVGLGTWKSKPGEVRRADSYALKNGYRHIDAALLAVSPDVIRHANLGRIYDNENEVGRGIKDSGFCREDIFITSKLWNTHQDDVQKGLQRTLDALGTDYLDLYVSEDWYKSHSSKTYNAWQLIHWPVRLISNETSELLPTNPDGSRSVDRSWDQSETWRQMEELYKQGKVKAIGVANWSIPYLEELRETWTVVPAVNQVELHPFLPQHALKDYCKKLGILLEAYSPLGSTGAPMMSDPEVQKVAEKHGVSAATILISYHVNKGVVALPKSVSEQRILSNKEVIPLPKEDLDMLDSLAAKGKAKHINTPLWGFDLGFADWFGPVKSK